MKLALALGAAAAAVLLAADAGADRGARIFVSHGSNLEIDGDGDSWVTRAEAAAAADRMFDRMDENGDGRLSEGDYPDFDIHVDAPRVEVLEGGDGDRRIRIVRSGPGGERVEREIAIAERVHARALRDAERAVARAEREAERAEAEAERAAEAAERMAESGRRHIVILRSVGDVEDVDVDVDVDVPPVPPIPPVPPHPPLFMMLFASSDEADLDGDGALSRDEFRAQQLRFFDASDANRDGRVRHERPRPPEPPEAPEPPEPPRRR